MSWTCLGRKSSRACLSESGAIKFNTASLLVQLLLHLILTPINYHSYISKMEDSESSADSGQQVSRPSPCMYTQPKAGTHKGQEEIPVPTDYPNPPPDNSNESSSSDYDPSNVTQIISNGHILVGICNDNTVLKYPSDPNNHEQKLKILKESVILGHLPSHPHIVEYLGYKDFAIKLRYYPTGPLSNYLSSNPNVGISQRIEWCAQLTSAVSFIHFNSVIHSDICLDNVLLNDRLEVVLTDFQGILLQNGEILVNGNTSERAKSYMPRSTQYHVLMGFKTDIFALGSAMYHILNGFEVFPELRDPHETIEIVNRFMRGKFPRPSYVGYPIVEKCWGAEYTSAAEVAMDLIGLQNIVR